MCNPPDVLDTSEGQNNLFSVKVIELRSNNKVKKILSIPTLAE